MKNRSPSLYVKKKSGNVPVEEGNRKIPMEPLPYEDLLYGRAEG
jgi:hypothetical protein